MTKLLVSLTFLGSLAACGDDEESDYERIRNADTCEEAQDEFNSAQDEADAAEPGSSPFNIAKDKMVVADQRLRELECY